MGGWRREEGEGGRTYRIVPHAHHQVDEKGVGEEEEDGVGEDPAGQEFVGALGLFLELLGLAALGLRAGHQGGVGTGDERGEELLHHQVVGPWKHVKGQQGHAEVVERRVIVLEHGCGGGCCCCGGGWAGVVLLLLVPARGLRRYTCVSVG